MVSTKSSWSLVGFSGFLVLGLSLWMSTAVFHRAPITSDETSYLFQAHAFLDGTIARDAPEIIEPFTARNSMLILEPRAGWLSRYPPAHSLWLVLGVLFGHPAWCIALAGALGVAWLVRVSPALSIRGWIVLVLALASPYFLFMYGTMLSHTSGFLAAAGLLACYLRWQTTSRPGWAALAGLCWSWIFLNRTYTALLIAIPFGIDALLALARKRTRQELMGTLSFAGCAAIGVLLILVYNKQATAEPFWMTYLYYNPSDNLGFGQRHHLNTFPKVPGYLHTPARGLGFLRDNLVLLDQWLFGFPGSLIAWLALSIAGWSRRWSWLLLSIPASVALGYVAFWFPGWDETGPIYYFETLPMMLFAAALGIERILRGINQQRPLAWAAAAVLALAWVGFTPGFVSTKAKAMDAVTAPRRELLDVYESAPDHSLLFLQEAISSRLWVSHDFLYNPRGEDSRVLVVRWMDDNANAMMHRYADRTPYLIEVADGGGYRLKPLDRESPLRVEFSLGNAHRTTGENRPNPNDPARTLRVAMPSQPAGWLLAAATARLYPGTFTAEFDLTISATKPGQPVDIDVSTDSGRTILASQTLGTLTTREPVRLTFSVEGFPRVEPRVHTQGGAEIIISGVRILETP